MKTIACPGCFIVCLFRLSHFRVLSSRLFVSFYCVVTHPNGNSIGKKNAYMQHRTQFNLDRLMSQLKHCILNEQPESQKFSIQSICELQDDDCVPEKGRKPLKMIHQQSSAMMYRVSYIHSFVTFALWLGSYYI